MVYLAKTPKHVKKNYKYFANKRRKQNRAPKNNLLEDCIVYGKREY